MTYLQAVILGLVQGLAEFLPISSSGHLAILENFFGIKEDSILFFAVMLHFGTLLSVFVVFWKDIVELFKELILTIKDLIGHKGLRLDERPIRKLGVMIIVSCIPTAIIGFAFGDIFEGIYSKPVLIGVMFIITGLLLLAAETWGGGNRNINNLNYRNFFLISIPTILGSFILELPDGLKEGVTGQMWGPVIVGMLVAFLSGLFAVKVMLKVVANKKLKYFSIYLFVLAAAVIIYSIINN